MLSFWYVCDGNIEEYKGQSADWKRSFVVCAKSPDDVIIKVLQYNQGRVQQCEVLYEGKVTTIIV